MASIQRTTTTETMLNLWVERFGTREVTLADVLHAATRDDALRAAIEAASGRPLAESARSISGLLRGRKRFPNGHSVASRMTIGSDGTARAIWQVSPREHTDGGEPASSGDSTCGPSDDDRLLDVLTAAIRERTITGTQADRIMALWLEV